jgi:hypothetical protein
MQSYPRKALFSALILSLGLAGQAMAATAPVVTRANRSSKTT